MLSLVYASFTSGLSNFEHHFAIMKKNELTSAHKEKQEKTLDLVQKELKKKEIQITILKKFIEKNNQSSLKTEKQ